MRKAEQKVIESGDGGKAKQTSDRGKAKAEREREAK